MFRTENGELVFEDEKELELAMEPSSDDSAEVIDYVLNQPDKIIFGEAPVATEEPEAPVEEPVEESVVEPEPVVEEEPVVKDNSIEIEEALAAANAKYERQLQESLAAREEEFNKKLEEIKQTYQKPEPAEEPAVEIDLEDEDEDLATGYEKNTRKLIEDIKKSNLQGSQEAQKIAELEGRLEQFFAAQEAQKKAEEENKARSVIFGELESFAAKQEESGIKEFSIPLAFGDAREEQRTYKEEIAKVLNLTAPGDIEKAYRKLARENTEWTRAQKQRLLDAKVEIPQYTKEYLNLIELYERKIGKRFNKYTGEYEPIKDSIGNTSVLPSIEDAYRLSDFPNLLAERENKASLEIQKKLEEQQSVATIDEGYTTSISGASDITEAEFNTLMSADLSAVIKNPEMLKKYAAAYQKVGMTPPPIAMKALKELNTK